MRAAGGSSAPPVATGLSSGPGLLRLAVSTGPGPLGVRAAGLGSGPAAGAAHIVIWLFGMAQIIRYGVLHSAPPRGVVVEGLKLLRFTIYNPLSTSASHDSIFACGWLNPHKRFVASGTPQHACDHNVA